MQDNLPLLHYALCSLLSSPSQHFLMQMFELFVAIICQTWSMFCVCIYIVCIYIYK